MKVLGSETCIWFVQVLKFSNERWWWWIWCWVTKALFDEEWDGSDWLFEKTILGSSFWKVRLPLANFPVDQLELSLQNIFENCPLVLEETILGTVCRANLRLDKRWNVFSVRVRFLPSSKVWYSVFPLKRKR